MEIHELVWFPPTKEELELALRLGKVPLWRTRAVEYLAWLEAEAMWDDMRMRRMYQLCLDGHVGYRDLSCMDLATELTGVLEESFNEEEIPMTADNVIDFLMNGKWDEDVPGGDE